MLIMQQEWLLAMFVKNLEGRSKVGVIAGVGNRRDEDNVDMGYPASEMFDEIIILQYKNLRGQTAEPLVDLLTEGIKNHDPNKKIKVSSSYKEAILHAIENAQSGALIRPCSDVVLNALKQVQDYEESEADTLCEFSTMISLTWDSGITMGAVGVFACRKQRQHSSQFLLASSPTGFRIIM